MSIFKCIQSYHNVYTSQRPVYVLGRGSLSSTPTMETIFPSNLRVALLLQIMYNILSIFELYFHQWKPLLQTRKTTEPTSALNHLKPKEKRTPRRSPSHSIEHEKNPKSFHSFTVSSLENRRLLHKHKSCSFFMNLRGMQGLNPAPRQRGTAPGSL